MWLSKLRPLGVSEKMNLEPMCKVISSVEDTADLLNYENGFYLVDPSRRLNYNRGKSIITR